MLERLNPIIRLVCLALAGLIVYQVSQLAFKRDVIARSSFNLSAIKTETKSTNAVPAKKETNAPPTNAAPPTASPPTEMAMPPGMSLPPGVSMPPGMGMPMRGGPGGRPGRGGGASDLPADVQVLVEKIKSSQILGPDIKPPPMALLGIAGKDVFLRAPSGQTGLVREGEELGGVKIIQIGTNRVLVEHEKQQKELMIFEGIGGESLTPKTEGKK